MAVQHQILGLDIPVHHALIVHILQCLGRLNDGVYRLVHRQWAILAHNPVQVAAFHELQNEVRTKLANVGIVGLYHIGMIKLGQAFHFPLEALEMIGVLLNLGVQYLDGDNSPHAFVPGFEHLPHAAFTQAVHYQVVVHHQIFGKFIPHDPCLIGGQQAYLFQKISQGIAVIQFFRLGMRFKGRGDLVLVDDTQPLQLIDCLFNIWFHERTFWNLTLSYAIFYGCSKALSKRFPDWLKYFQERD